MERFMKSISVKAKELMNFVSINSWENIINNSHLENYANPPIIDGYVHVCGEWHNGFVIERISDGSQFVWIPVGALTPNGTLDGESFTERFGRRDYGVSYTHTYLRKDNWYNGFKKFYEPISDELSLQIESIKKYGGFYFARYTISRNNNTKKPQSISHAMPWVNISYFDARRIASNFENSKTVTSHLTFGAEYDSVLEWFIESKARTREEIVVDSGSWGNIWNAPGSSRKLLETGSREEWCTNNIYDLAGNADEFTQEIFENDEHIIVRGSNCYYDSSLLKYEVKGITKYGTPVAKRVSYRIRDDLYGTFCTSFRVALCIK